jgi:uncharacterized protein with PQ loop repeat
MTLDGGAASGVTDCVCAQQLGWVSIACWVVVYSPQIVENYQMQSGEGLSLPFVIIWLLGDLCNLSGALMANLLPTVIILGAYYTFNDLILLFQIFYYRWKNPATRSAPGPSDLGSGSASENAPLLPNGPPVEFVEEPKSTLKEVLKYALTLGFVCAAGVVAWAVSEQVKDSDAGKDEPEQVLEWRSQVLGWLSAILFLGARIPQILKNRKTRMTP